MIVRYHLTDGTTLDEEVEFPTGTKEMSVALAETLLIQTRSPQGTIVSMTPVISVDVLTKDPAHPSWRAKKVRNLIFTSQILRMELILSDMEERREAGLEGKN